MQFLLVVEGAEMNTFLNKLNIATRVHATSDTEIGSTLFIF